MTIPSTRNAKGEDIGKFAAEMAQLAKQPNMRPYLTSAEARRQEREAKREAEAEQKRKEEWMIEAKRRDDITGQWFNSHMTKLAPKLWKAFKRTQDPTGLFKAGWELIADMTTATKEGHEPTPCTVCTIKYKSKARRIERLVWEEPKPLQSKIIKPSTKLVKP